MDESMSWPQGHSANTVGAWIDFVFSWWATCSCGFIGESCTTEEDADWDRLDHVTTPSAEADGDQVQKTAQMASLMRGLKIPGMTLERGLTASELSAIEGLFDFTFAPDHRALLAEALPVGDDWPPWRAGPEHVLQRWIKRPVEDLVACCRDGSWWFPGWGERPHRGDYAEKTAALMLAGVPTLVPLHQNRFVASDQGFVGPVFSVYPGDTIVIAASIAEYLPGEAEPPTSWKPPGQSPSVPFWSEVVLLDQLPSVDD